MPSRSEAIPAAAASRAPRALPEHLPDVRAQGGQRGQRRQARMLLLEVLDLRVQMLKFSRRSSRLSHVVQAPLKPENFACSVAPVRVEPLIPPLVADDAS
mmetsp:Transcript_67783/g.214456  ORF Transcript_67783/g.214456 Transcript_67783/m.214456 type:complete len:100 (-) Transcript_67783:495-794(-)